jgi:hypothetical protein
MYILSKFITDITINDLENLVANQVSESKVLDYKRDFNIDDGKDKLRGKFIDDICAMHNTEGGCIIYGIEDKIVDGKKTGLPEKLVGIDKVSRDVTSQRIHNIVMSNTDPTITNIQIQYLDFEERDILIIGVSKSFGLPSMNTFEKANKFYRRNSVGNYAVDTMELNQMFMQNQTVKEGSEKFRMNRIKEIRRGSVLRNLLSEGQLFIHIIPYSFLNEKILDLKNLLTEDNFLSIHPLEGGWSGNLQLRYNVDGLLTFWKKNEINYMNSFNQYFRNGIIELFTTYCYFKSSDNIHKRIDGGTIVKYLITSIYKSFGIMKDYQIEPPLFVYVSLVNVNEAHLVGLNSTTLGQFNCSNVFLPPITISSYNMNFEELYNYMQPYLDILWQAADVRNIPAYPDFGYYLFKK